MSTKPEETKYFRPRNWRQWQTYKAANPKYIRNETALLYDPDYMALNWNQRAVLHGLWLLCAAVGKALPWDCAYLARALHLPWQVVAKALPVLERSNFIELCEKEWKSFPIYTETETETETESKKVRSRDGKTSRAKPTKKSYPEAFEKFWQPIIAQNLTHEMTPGNKSEAFEAWKKFAADIPPEKLLDRWRGYVAQSRTVDSKTQHVRRWLRHEDFSAPGPEPEKPRLYGAAADEAQRAMRVKGFVDHDLWLPQWGDEPTPDEIRSVVGEA